MPVTSDAMRAGDEILVARPGTPHAGQSSSWPWAAVVYSFAGCATSSTLGSSAIEPFVDVRNRDIASKKSFRSSSWLMRLECAPGLRKCPWTPTNILTS
jgi:hypothetical protein